MSGHGGGQWMTRREDRKTCSKSWIKRKWWPRSIEAHVRRLEGRCLVDRRDADGAEFVARVTHTHAVSKSSFAESFVLAQRRDRGERLTAVLALYLLPAVGVHALVPAEVGELCVGLEADLALERLDAAVDVLMLLEAAGGRKCLPTVLTCVGSRADVLRADVALQIAGVREVFVAVLAKIVAAIGVDHL